VAPHSVEIDHEGVFFENGEAGFGPRQEGIFKQIKDLDLHGMCLPRELGGVNAPVTLSNIHLEMLARAEPSVMTHHSFHSGIAISMLVFSIDEGTTEFDREKLQIVQTRFAEPIAEIAAGKAWGCMDITEPDAGSDMASVRTLGEQDENGSWYVSGQKIFITSGNGKYHFVIARTESDRDSSGSSGGLSGLSMFLVKTYDDNADGSRTWHAKIDRLEEKLGRHPSVTAALTFDRTRAELVGQRGEGFKYMLKLMNGARITVGFESIGVCEAAFRMAQSYAEERVSMGKPIAQHEMIADCLDEMQTDIKGLRALAMYAAVHQDVSELERLRLRLAPPKDEIERKKLEQKVKWHQRRLRRATPLLKYLAAERAVHMTRMCVQIHGGNGYTTDYGAEKLLRDAVVLPIYEGTSQIQALMATRDSLNGILKNPQGFLRRRAQARLKSVSGREALERRVARVQTRVFAAEQHLIMRIVGKKFRSLHGQPISAWPQGLLKDWDPKRDFSHALLHAEHLTRLMGEAAICRILLEQTHRHPERRETLERYLERAEPRCRFLADQITTTGERLLEELHAPEIGERAAG
jgi:alkylation response protein AidB-like acyl-CoA dehydrogenase